MNIDLDGEIVVSLSERNLRDLFAQMESKGERNPFLGGVEGVGVVGQLVRTCTLRDGQHVFLRVIIEPDEKHYADRTAGPGTIDEPAPGFEKLEV